MEEDEEAKQTPIKSWLRKHMNSEKSPEREDSPPQKTKTSSNLPQYIIPLVRIESSSIVLFRNSLYFQEPEERTCDGYSSSSEEEDAAQRRKKKSPKRPGRPKHERARLHSNSDLYSYDTTLSNDSVGNIRMTLTRGDEFDFPDEDDFVMQPSARPMVPQHHQQNQQKRPRGRPKGSKNKPKDERILINKTPKKKMFASFGNIQHQPPVIPPKSHQTPTVRTTPSPPTPTHSWPQRRTRCCSCSGCRTGPRSHRNSHRLKIKPRTFI